MTGLIAMFALWAVVALVVLGLIIYRRVVAGEEDDVLHMRDDEGALVAHQVAVAKKLEVIDKWGKLLTVVAVVYGLGLGGYYLYISWVTKNVTSVNVPILQ